MNRDREDRDAIRDLVRNWVVWREAGDRERFRGFKGYRHRADIQEETGHRVKRRDSGWLGGAAVSPQRFLQPAIG